MLHKVFTYCKLRTITSFINLNGSISVLLVLLMIFGASIIPKNSISQDLHYSQYLNSPLNLNPDFNSIFTSKFIASF